MNGEQACLTYFATEDGEIYGSLGDSQREGVVEFCAGGQKTEMAAYTVIPLDLAVECARQFFHSQERPSCIGWDDL